MKFRLIGWKSEGLRCPDVAVDLQIGKKLPQIALIQMPNGTGKTTTLSMIHAALTGEAKAWSAEKIKTFRSVQADTAEGRFKLELSVDDSPLTFEMRFDFVDGQVEYKTTAPSLGGVVSDWKPPTSARRFLTEQFVNLFVFDGEFSDRLLDTTRTEADKAIDALCQLYLLDDINRIAEDVWQRMTRGQGAKTQTGLTQAKNQEKALQQRIANVEQLREKATAELERLKKRAAELKKFVDEQISADKQDREQLEAKKAEENAAERTVEQAVTELMDHIRQPFLLAAAFPSALRTFKTQLDRVRLPESTSRQFFLELAEEKECVCGRPMDDDAKTHVREHAGKYLGEEIAGVVNTLKQDIEMYARPLVGTKSNQIMEKTSALQTRVNEWHSAKNEKDLLENQLLERGSDEVHKKRSELIDTEHNIEATEDLLTTIDSRPTGLEAEDTHCLARLRQDLNKIRDKVADITGTVDIRHRTDILKRVAESVKGRARDMIRSQLLDDINARLARVLYRDPITVDKIEGAVVLGRGGASVGQTLAVGYVFLTSLLHRGQHQFPLLVDSPANPIDLTVRREIARLVPQLCEQFVALTISSERDGFVAPLHEQSQGNIKYITLFRKTAGAEKLRHNLPTKGIQETANGILIEGKEYFEQFDVESEAEI